MNFAELLPELSQVTYPGHPTYLLSPMVPAELRELLPESLGRPSAYLLPAEVSWRGSREGPASCPNLLSQIVIRETRPRGIIIGLRVLGSPSLHQGGRIRLG